MDIIHPPSQHRRDVDKKSRMKHRNHQNPLGTSYSYEDEEQTNNVGCKQPELFLWKRDLDIFFGNYQPSKNTKTYVEWKKNASKRRKKKKRHGNEGHALRDSVSQDEGTGTLELPYKSSSAKRVTSGKYDAISGPEIHSRKENAPPPSSSQDQEDEQQQQPQQQQQQFKPTFSRSRYSNLQKFRTLAAYYRQKEKLIAQVVTKNHHRDSESVGDLANIKKELADLKRWATTKNEKTKTKKVQFAHPLISQLKYRPKTRPEEIDELYFREEELLDWEEDRETTSPEFVELVITDDDVEPEVNISEDQEDY